MKSVILSSILLGSRTKVGKVTLDRSIPTLNDVEVGAKRYRRNLTEAGI